MSNPLILAFLFYCGATIGWVLEFFYRNLISHNGPRMLIFINPGFCRGPYLPIYGIGVVVMFILTFEFGSNTSVIRSIIAIFTIGLCMTIIEFIGGIMLLKFCNLRLWDYRDEPGNVMGVICPKFTFIWTALGGLFYIFIYPLCIDSIYWLADNLAFSFFIGFFFGVFLIDMATTNSVMKAIKHYGDEHEVVIRYEELKHHIQKMRQEAEQRKKFINQTYIENRTYEDILEMLEEIKEDKSKAFVSNRKRKK